MVIPLGNGGLETRECVERLKYSMGGDLFACEWFTIML